jgi:hypothetical protein
MFGENIHFIDRVFKSFKNSFVYDALKLFSGDMFSLNLKDQINEKSKQRKDKKKTSFANYIQM